MEIYNCLFKHNQAFHGGAIFLLAPGNEIKRILIYNTLFIHNTAHDGGALRVDRGVYYLENVRFISNIAKADGGAINDVMAIEACNIHNSSNYSYVAHVGRERCSIGIKHVKVRLYTLQVVI